MRPIKYVLSFIFIILLSLLVGVYGEKNEVKSIQELYKNISLSKNKLKEYIHIYFNNQNSSDNEVNLEQINAAIPKSKKEGGKKLNPYNCIDYVLLKEQRGQRLHAKNIYDDNIKRLVSDEFELLGLLSTKNNAHNRVPCDVAKSVSNEVLALSRHTSGGRLKFITTSDKIIFKALVDTKNRFSGMPHGNGISGIDIYVQNQYKKSAYPSNDGFIDITVSNLGGKKKVVEIYFPLYSELYDFSVWIERSSIVKKHPGSKKDKFVYYGSSITQGCCASNPGMTYQSIIYRNNNINYLNLGFAGNGLGDIEIANYIAELKPSLIVLDYWANPTSKSYSKTLPQFVSVLRKELPTSYIYIMSTFYNPGREEEQRKKDTASLSIVTSLRNKGDDKINFVNNLLNREDAAGLVDGRHLNSYGFKLIAERLGAFLDETYQFMGK